MANETNDQMQDYSSILPRRESIYDADNGFSKPAVTDIPDPEEEVEEVVELAFDQKYDLLAAALVKQPLNREILYKTLVFCQEEHILQDIEKEIATFPEFPRCVNNQYAMITNLTRNYGLELIERDIDGNVVTPEMKEGLTEDEEDDLVYSFHYVTTDVGRAFVENYSPKARLIELLDLRPERKDTYIELLDYLRTPHSYPQIEALLKGRPALETIINGHIENMQPSVFVDKLERAGVIYFVSNKGWALTEDGVSYLEEMVG